MIALPNPPEPVTGSLVPLTVVCIPRQAVAGYDPPELPGLLAWAVVQAATEGRGLADTPEPYDIPLPLECLWRDEAGLPLWAGTPFQTCGVTASDVVYHHKRHQDGLLTAGPKGVFRVTPMTGRWVDRRTPTPAVVAEAWSATCIGNAARVAALLSTVTHLGKRRNTGLGEVAEWRIEPRDAWSLVEGDRLTIAVPEAARAMLPAEPAERPRMLGWTPPYWKPSLWSAGWPAGTEVPV